ncbi:MAG TPA: hypothetical protein VM840_11635 [Actinomycetota bacterium]|nr:hypothetical protein [Actinomycetota bacterium]
MREHLEVVSEDPLPVPADCQDGFLCAYWARPEAYLEPDVVSNISALAMLDPDVLRRAQDRLAHDLRTGAWDERHGHLRSLSELDCGYRLVLAGSRSGSG